GLPVAGDDRHDYVPVGGAAGFIDGGGAVSVTGEGQANPAPAVGSQGLGVGGTAAVVAVHAVGLGRQHPDIRLEPPEQLRRRFEGGAVGTVEGDLETAQAVDGHVGEVVDVLVESIGVDEADSDGAVDGG